MKQITKLAAAASLTLLGVASASALELVSPAPGSTTTVSQIQEISLKFDEDVQGMPEPITISNKSTGDLVGEYQGDYDWADWTAYLFQISPAITTPGEYVVNIPENIDPDNSTPAYEIYYVVEGASYTTEPGVPTSVVPAPGSDIVQNDAEYVQFNKITLNFAEDSYLIGALDSTWTLTNAAGEPVPFTISGFYIKGDPMLQYTPNPFINIDFNEDGLLPSGTYTLTIPAGSIDLERGTLGETLVYTWNYTKTRQEADPTPLEIIEAWVGQATNAGYMDSTWDGENKVAFVDGMTIGNFTACGSSTPGSALLFVVNHGEKTGAMAYEIRNLTTAEIMRTGWLQKLEDNSFLFACVSDLRFFNDTKYSFSIHAYSEESSQTRVEFGNGAEITFTGETEPYKYSSAELVALNPDTNVDLDNLEGKKAVLTSLEQNKMTYVFSEPVTLTRCEVNLGFGASEPAAHESKSGEAYDRVWYVTIPESLMLSYPAVEVILAAKGEDGLIVKGNYGIEDNACYQLGYEMTLCQPRIVIGQTDSHVPGINTFTITSDGAGAKKAINCSYLAYPVVLNEKGEQVAEINNYYYYDAETWTDYAYKPVQFMTMAGGTQEPTELEFQMVPAISTPGKYTLHFPAAAINFGTEFDSDTSVAQDFVFYVCEFVDADFSDGNCTIALPAVEKGKSATINVTPAENWKLASLMLNGADVTENVEGDFYTTPALSEAAHLVATFAFDGIVVTPTDAAEIVTDLQLRGWSEGGSMYVSGLKDGQVVRLYTVAGSLIESQGVATGDETSTLKLEAPAGVYVITVTDGTQTVAIKLQNK